MNRREALSATALLMGGTLIGATAFLNGCKKRDAQIGIFHDTDILFLDEVGETILPATDTPGAKSVHIGEFMRVIVTECYSAEEQKTFASGIPAIDALSRKKYNKTFLESTASEKKELLIMLDAEAKTNIEAPHYFTMMKQLTVWGFFSSEVGATQAMRYIAIPGRWEGCMPYTIGDKAWA